MYLLFFFRHHFKTHPDEQLKGKWDSHRKKNQDFNEIKKIFSEPLGCEEASVVGGVGELKLLLLLLQCS